MAPFTFLQESASLVNGHAPLPGTLADREVELAALKTVVRGVSRLHEHPHPSRPVQRVSPLPIVFELSPDDEATFVLDFRITFAMIHLTPM